MRIFMNHQSLRTKEGSSRTEKLLESIESSKSRPRKRKIYRELSPWLIKNLVIARFYVIS